jgi:predicted transcriptional regulator
MACVRPDGTLSKPAKIIMNAMDNPITLDQLAETVDIPMYRIRSSTRELMEAGMIEQLGEDKYVVTTGGRQRLQE